MIVSKIAIPSMVWGTSYDLYFIFVEGASRKVKDVDGLSLEVSIKDALGGTSVLTHTQDLMDAAVLVDDIIKYKISLSSDETLITPGKYAITFMLLDARVTPAWKKPLAWATLNVIKF